MVRVLARNMQGATVRGLARLWTLYPLVRTADLLISPDLLRISVRDNEGPVAAADRAPHNIRGAVTGTVAGDEGEAAGIAEVKGIIDNFIVDGVLVAEPIDATGVFREFVSEDPKAPNLVTKNHDSIDQ
jgi:hypothetical protein